jgi:hypothetical protein
MVLRVARSKIAKNNELTKLTGPNREVSPFLVVKSEFCVKKMPRAREKILAAHLSV